MREISQDCNELGNASGSGAEDADAMGDDVDGIDTDLTLRTCSIPDTKVAEFQEACAEVLATAYVLKDNFDPNENGLSSLPEYVRDFVLPMIPMSDIKRPYVILDTDQKLFFGDVIGSPTGVLVDQGDDKEENDLDELTAEEEPKHTMALEPIDEEHEGPEVNPIQKQYDELCHDEQL